MQQSSGDVDVFQKTALYDWNAAGVKAAVRDLSRLANIHFTHFTQTRQQIHLLSDVTEVIVIAQYQFQCDPGPKKLS